MITGIDHIALQVRDQEATAKAYEVILGRAPNWRGDLGGVRHVWFQLPNIGLDIVAADGDGEGQREMRAQIDKHGEGIWGLGFAVSDLAEAIRVLERRGVAMFPPAVTRSTNAEGEVREWPLATARRRSAHGVAQFFVERKPDAVRWPIAPPVGSKDEAVAGLDHIVVNTANPERAAAYYGARLGLDLRLDRSNEQWGSRLLFFRCGDCVVEVGASLKAPVSDAFDKYGGLAWRIADPAAARARMAAAGIDVSELRKGRKPGTEVFTVRSETSGVPTLMIGVSA